MQTHLFIRILNMSLTSVLMILAVLALRLLLRRAPRIFVYALWAVVLFRLLCPVSFESSFSLLSVLRAPTTEGGSVEYISQEFENMMSWMESIPEDVTGQDMMDSGRGAKGAGSEGAAGGVPGNGFLARKTWQAFLHVGGRVWMLGVLAMLFCGAVSYGRLCRRLRGAGEAGLGERGRIRIRCSGTVSTPFVLGFLRPCIYLPKDLPEKDLEYILLHERIHIRRGDPLTRAAAYLALCLHWFNPFVWLAFFLSGRDMEMSCDEAVIDRIGNEGKKDYSASLLSLATGKQITAGIPLAFGEGEPGVRIKNVLRYKRPAFALAAAALAVCVLAAVFLLGNPGKQEKKEMETPEAETVEPYIEMDFTSMEEGAAGQVPDGTYWVYPRSISRSARCFDRYVTDVSSDDQDKTVLVPAFSDDCAFLVNREMDSVRFEEISFEEFADLITDACERTDVSVLCTFQDNLIVEARLMSACISEGISYIALTAETSWFEDICENEGRTMDEMLEEYYELARTEEADVSDAPGPERIEIYLGNIGDGDSGMILIYDADGNLLHTESAHSARAGWVNFYEGELDGTPFLLSVHIEDRDNFGEYWYQVYRLGETGTPRQIAGSDFQWRSSILYDDGLFREWADKLEHYLANSHLLLSSQEGELRTEAVSEADKYNYGTLHR